jgi:glutathione synthase/RimK-type ligase-like ATP-grasp enzyme
LDLGGRGGDDRVAIVGGGVRVIGGRRHGSGRENVAQGLLKRTWDSDTM